MKPTNTGTRHRINALLAGTLLALAIQHASATQPNVVFLLSDDQSYGDYGFMGHLHIKTPNIDQLARAGVVYERGYVTAPLCRPSLASMVTGLYPHQIGIRGNDPIHYKNASKQKQVEMRKRMTAPFGKQPSFIQSLKENGYATLQTGKWWEGNPLDHGFTDAMTHGDPAKGGRHGDKGLDIGRKTMQPIYDFVDKAQADDQPFFIWYGVFLPHAPHNAPDRLFNHYKDVAPNPPTARYWANVEWLDEGCGQIIDYLKKKGLYDNTIFIYTCDNGWVQDPDKMNQSIRSKRDPVEAGIRTPIIVTHEGSLNPLRDAVTLASNIDVATTILKSCGIEPPAPMSGLDLRDSAALKKRDRIFVDVYDHDSDLEQLHDPDSCLKAHVVIDGWNKLTSTPSGDELYDLKQDPDDRHNIAGENPERVAELSTLIANWLKATPPEP